MVSAKLDEKAIFNVARKIDSPDDREEYLHQVCGADQNLFERVDTLLRAYEMQAGFLELPPAGRAPPTIDLPITESPRRELQVSGRLPYSYWSPKTRVLSSRRMGCCRSSVLTCTVIR